MNPRSAAFAAALVLTSGLAVAGGLGDRRAVLLSDDFSERLGYDDPAVRSITSLAINNQGLVAFGTDFILNASGENQYFDGIFAETSTQSIGLVAQSGQSTIEGEGTYYRSVYGPIGFNSAGQVAYRARLGGVNAQGDVIGQGNDHRVYLSDSSGTRSVWTQGLSFNPHILNYVRDITLSETGMVSIAANFRRDVGNGVYDGYATYTDPVGLELLQIEFQDLTGSSLGISQIDTENHQRNDMGQALFTGRTPIGRRVLARVGPGGEGTLIARETRDAPGESAGVTVSSFVQESIALGDSGHFAYAADLSTGGGALYKGTSASDVSVVARRGELAPGIGGGVVYERFLGENLLDGSGNLLFHAQLGGDSVSVGVDDRAIFFERGGTPGLVVRLGDTIGEGSVSEIRSTTLGSSGVVSFTAALDDGDLALVGVSAIGTRVLIAQEGELFDVSAPDEDEDLRVVETIVEDLTRMNDRGELVYALEFEDGSRGVFVTTIPAPSSVALCVLGGVFAARRRRG